MSKMSLKLTDEPLLGLAGLISIGEMFRTAAIDEAFLHRESMAKPFKDRGILRAMCGLFTLGRTDFVHIRPFRADEFFAQSRGLQQVPSEATLRQRFQQMSKDQRVIDSLPDCSLPDCSLRLWKKFDFKPRAIERDKRKWVRVDLDPTILNVLDCAFESAKVVGLYRRDPKADFIIKHNLRKEGIANRLETAKTHGVAHSPQPGKTVWRGNVTREVKDVGPVRLVFEVTERTEKHGRLLLSPEVTVFSVLPSLDLPEKEVLRLYRDRGTYEQYFAELKSELDLERPPSGKFKANELFYQVGMLVYNMLRMPGDWLLRADDLGLKKANRRRLRTVMRGVMLMCGRMMKHARRQRLNVVGDRGWGEALMDMHGRLCSV